MPDDLVTLSGDALNTILGEAMVTFDPWSPLPSLNGFYTFIQTVMQPPNTFDPAVSLQVRYAFEFALQWVNPELVQVPSIPMATSLYAMAVYNLAADTLIAWQPDSSDAPIFAEGLPYWAYLRKKYNVLAFVPGIIQSTSDEGTSSSYLLPESYSGYTIANIQNTKTPYGRAYLGIAQSQGTLWGLS